MSNTHRATKTGHESQALIPRQAVARMFGVCTRTVKRWEPLHNLTPHRITSRLTAYPADEIERIKSDARVAGAEAQSA
jgi:hypothetical protein